VISNRVWVLGETADDLGHPAAAAVLTKGLGESLIICLCERGVGAHGGCLNSLVHFQKENNEEKHKGALWAEKEGSGIRDEGSFFNQIHFHSPYSFAGNVPPASLISTKLLTRVSEPHTHPPAKSEVKRQRRR